MRILVVGAGAIGGYFGGRLLAAGRDVTFLVRPRRAAQLASEGLVIRSGKGDVTLPALPAVSADDLHEPFDLILLSCKAYDLDGAIASFAPAVGPDTVILPLLNGMNHLDVLAGRFGRKAVLGGLCMIASTLDPAGTIMHLNDFHEIVFGELDGARSERLRAIADTMEGAVFDARLSEQILHEMWEKWAFLAPLAAGTCLLRASVGDIGQAPGGTEIMLGLLEECRAIAEANGFPPRAAVIERIRRALTEPGSTLTASMLRDIEGNARIEADHVIGDLIRRGRAAETSDALTLLRMAYTHLKAYEARRKHM